MRRLFGSAALLLFLTACSASTSHFSSFEMGKNEYVTTPTTVFGPTDVFYAKANASNIAAKETVTFVLSTVKVTGQKPNAPLRGSIKSYDIDDDSTIKYQIALPSSIPRWPAGTYKLTTTMTDGGIQRDQKAIVFTVSR